MTYKTCKNGLMLSCLLILSACSSVPPSPVPTNIELGCPRVIPCYLPPINPIKTENLLHDIEQLLQAWHACAAQVDMIYQCQETLNEQTQPTTRTVN